MNRLLPVLFLALLVFVPTLAFAQTPVTSGSGQTGTPVNSGSGQTAPPITLMNPLNGGESLEGFLISILRLFVRVGTVVLVAMVIWIGFLFIWAQGNPESLNKAKTMLLWTLIGGLILLGAEGIARGIHATVNSLGGGTTQTQTSVPQNIIR